MELSAIKNIVKAKMDEITPLTGVTHPIDAYMLPLLDESRDQLLREGPIHLMPIKDISSGIVYGANLTPVETDSYVPTPDDFIRIAKFKFSDWVNEALTSISADSPEHKKVQNAFLKGGTEKPVVVETHEKLSGDSSIIRYLKCLDVSTDASVEYLYYVYNSDVTEFDVLLIDPLTWLTASKLMQVFEMQNFKFAEERYQYFIQSNRK